MEVKTKVIKFLTERDVNLEDFLPKEWDEELTGKAETIVAMLTGKQVALTEKAAKGSSNDMSAVSDIDDLDDDLSANEFFDSEDDE